MTRVTLDNLTKTYANGQPPAVANLSLTIEPGTLTALLGPSGSGKSTTMKMIAGLLRPSSGEIQFDGRSVVDVPPEKRSAVMVFQNYLLFPYMSVGENVGFGLKMRGVDKQTIRERVREMLALVQLPGIEQRRPRELSGGQQQRVALARALIVEPAVLLLDEPLSNLDAHLRDEMRDLIRRVQQQTHITTLFVTHDQEEAVLLADKIALLFDGALHQYAPPPAFFDAPASVRVARFFGGKNFIPGVCYGEHIETAVGTFHAAECSREPGAAVLTIRPEAVALDGAGHENTAPGRVVSCLYAGRYTRLRVAVGDYTVEVVTEPGQARRYSDGDSVTLHFPADHVWLLPPDASVPQPVR